MDLIFKAMKFAEKKHRNQRRKYSDAPYYIHPFRVMYRLRDTGYNNENLLCAALLHDTLEDTETTFQELEEQFNKNIAFLVLELTQPDKLSEEVHKLPRVERHNLLLEKLKIISVDAKRVKYFDRLDNLSEVDLSNNECYGFLKRRYLQESFDIWKILKQDIWRPNNDELEWTIRDLAYKCKIELNWL